MPIMTSLDILWYLWLDQVLVGAFASASASKKSQERVVWSLRIGSGNTDTIFSCPASANHKSIHLTKLLQINQEKCVEKDFFSVMPYTFVINIKKDQIILPSDVSNHELIHIIIYS